MHNMLRLWLQTLCSCFSAVRSLHPLVYPIVGSHLLLYAYLPYLLPSFRDFLDQLRKMRDGAAAGFFMIQGVVWGRMG